MFFFPEMYLSNLLSLALVGESFWVLLLFGGVIVLEVMRILTEARLGSLKESASPPGAPSPEEGPGGGDSPSAPEGGGDSNWKKWLLLVTAVVVTTGVSIAVGGYIGWGDPLFAWKQPTLFGAALVDQAGRLIPGLTFTPAEITPFVEVLFPKVWSGATSLDTLMPKLLNAGVSPQNWGIVTRKLAELGADSAPIVQAVVNNFPAGASEISVRLALEVAVNDQVDTLLLEYATEYW